RAVAVESIEQAGANTVINHADARANRGFIVIADQALQPAPAGTGGVGKSQAWREVVIVPVVIPLSAIGRTGQTKADGRQVGSYTGVHVLAPGLKPLAQADGRRYLRTVGLPWRREQRITQAVRDGQVRLH